MKKKKGKNLKVRRQWNHFCGNDGADTGTGTVLGGTRSGINHSIEISSGCCGYGVGG